MFCCDEIQQKQHLLVAAYDETLLYLQCIVQHIRLIFKSSEGKISDRNVACFYQLNDLSLGKH